MTREELIEELKNQIGFDTDNETYTMSNIYISGRKGA